MPSFIDSFKKRWNAFLGRNPTSKNEDLGSGSYRRPDTSSLWRTYEKSIVTTIYNKIAVDVAAVDIEHVRTDDEGRYIETLSTNFNRCLNFSANIDQTGRELIQDIAMTMFDEGYVAVFITDATADPNGSQHYDILSLRAGRIVEWYPQHVKVEVYNERTGKRQEEIVAKTICSIIRNPFYDIMNRPNSTLKRLKNLLNDLDALNKYATSGKLDIIIQLPYALKTEAKLEQANIRRKNLEDQLKNSELGIGYIDASEKVIQLGRTLENNLWKQAQELEDKLYAQLGLSPEVFNGTADYLVMNNYFNGTIVPILRAITESMRRVFISRNAQTRGETVMYFRDPLKSLSIADVADVGDRLTRNEILSPNEFRGALGYRPNPDPKSDELRNRNIAPTEGYQYPTTSDQAPEEASYEGGGEQPVEEGADYQQ